MFKYEQTSVPVIQVQPIALFFAFRYALGRRTYAPSIVAMEIKANLSKMPTLDLQGISDEIVGAKVIGTLGDECDIRTWMNLHELIKVELERRGHE